MSDRSPPFVSPPAAGTLQPRPQPSRARPPPGWAGLSPQEILARYKPGSAAAEGAGRPHRTLQHPAHVVGENGIAQDTPGAGAVPAPLLPGPAPEGRVQDGA